MVCQRSEAFQSVTFLLCSVCAHSILRKTQQRRVDDQCVSVDANVWERYFATPHQQLDRECAQAMSSGRYSTRSPFGILGSNMALSQSSKLQVHPKLSHSNTPATSPQSDNIDKSHLYTDWKEISADVSAASPGSLPEELTSQSRPWKDRILLLGPVSGALALLVALGSIAASLGVLFTSDGAKTSLWPVAPPVYLASFTAIANLSMRFACIQGVVVSWWIGALRGATLARLHNDWRSGTTLHGAITAGRQIGLLGLATIFSTVVVVDGPLLQRSTTITLGTYAHGERPVKLNFTMAPQIPTGYSGRWQTNAEFNTHRWSDNVFNATKPGPNGVEVPNNIFVTPDIVMLRDVAPAYSGDRLLVLPGPVTGCDTFCTAKIQAPALHKTSCSSYQIEVDYKASTMLPLTQDYSHAVPLNQQLFFISTTIVLGENETMSLISGYSQTTGCSGSLRYTTCLLESAVGEYDVYIDNDPATGIAGLRIDNSQEPRILAISNNTAVSADLQRFDEWHPSTLGGVAFMVQEKWTSNFQAGVQDGLLSMGPSGFYAWTPYIVDPTATCPSFTDPHREVIGQLNTAMVYAGAVAATKPRSFLEPRLDPGMIDLVNTTVTGYDVGTYQAFRTDYRWFFAAAAVEIVCVCFVLPTFWGMCNGKWNLLHRKLIEYHRSMAAWSTSLFQSLGDSKGFRGTAACRLQLELLRPRFGKSSAQREGQVWSSKWACL